MLYEVLKGAEAEISEVQDSAGMGGGEGGSLIRRSEPLMSAKEVLGKL
jgi:hypothetical protein